MDPFDLREWPGLVSAGGNPSHPVIVDQITIDSRRIASHNPLFIALKGEKQDGHQYIYQAIESGAKYILASSHWQPKENLGHAQLLQVPDPLKALQQIAKAYRLQFRVKMIGITGSFGKTMVKDLLYALLSTHKKTAASPESFNSQIGVPLSLLTLKKEHEVALIEAAISEKQEMCVLADLIRPDYTLLTPIGKKHLATLNDLPTLASEVMQLIVSTPVEGWSLVPDDPLIYPCLSQLKNPHYFWNKEEEPTHLPHAKQLGKDYTIPSPYRLVFPDQQEYRGEITGGYPYFLNLINMAVKAAWLMGTPVEQIKKVLETYQLEPMRTEIWESPVGATFINDSYCSDPQSINVALRHFDLARNHRKIFIFGGMKGKSQPAIDYQWIGKALKKISLDRLILFGDKNFAPLIEELKNSPTLKHPIAVYQTPIQAFQALQGDIQSHDYILIKGEKRISFDHLIESFNDSPNTNQCIINLAAIKSNILNLRKKLSSSTRLMVIVKALAYGTDDVRLSKYLTQCGVDIVGVSYVDEGVALKRAGVEQAIFSINAAPYEAAKVAKWNLEVGVSDAGLIEALSQEAKKQNTQVKVHLHINTGMSRFGCRPEEALQLAQLIQASPSLILEGIMTHFPCADEAKEDEFTHGQIRCFDQVLAELKAHHITPRWIHAANSSGAIRFDLPQYNMVRIGLAVYGLYCSDAIQQTIDLRLALSLTSRIVGINLCKKGESVSYGRTYKIEKDFQKIAVLPVGYFDGIHRHYSGKAHVLIRGHKAPMVGNICMDYMMVDVTEIPDVKVGDKVLIFGEDEFGQYLSPEELASSGGSIVHELITCLGPRIQRVFVYEEGHQIR